MKFSIIPTEKEYPKVAQLIDKYDVALEYNDFFFQEVYSSKEETDRLIEFYTSQGRDMSGDTLHGVFYGVDITAMDKVLRDRSRKLYYYSMETAKRLGVKGVVFHSSLIGNLKLDYYIKAWVSESEEFFRELAAAYPHTDIYLENTFEEDPTALVRLAKNMEDVPNFGLCFDYAHAMLTPTPIEKWCMELAPFVRHMHINDNDLHRDLHLVPGEGCIDYAKFNFLLDKYKIDTSVLIEVQGAEKAKKSLEFLHSDRTSATYQPKVHNVLSGILGVSVALSSEKDPNKLLSLIVNTAMELTDSDGGSLYLLHDNALHFRILITKSKGFEMGIHGEQIDLPPVPLESSNICAHAALIGHSLNIENVYDCDEYDFTGPKKYDALNDYKTQSMVAIPLIDSAGEVMGVLQLINAQTKGIVRAFSAEEEFVIQALGSQAAIALSNMNYLNELIDQMWSFTEALTEAIDARTPYNASHTRKVAEYSGLIMDQINKLHDEGEVEEYFDQERRDQVVMASFLHDIGKLVIPMEIMNKQTRLGDRYEEFMNRVRTIGYKCEIAYLKNQISEDYYKEISNAVTETLEIIPTVNRAGFVEPKTASRLEDLFLMKYEAGGETMHFFTEDEKTALRIKNGTLTDEEREEMESHVLMTDRILGKVHFNRYFGNTRKWAAEHHERINGKGYPNHISGDDLCIESRIIAVADICDALIASDRPYRTPIPKDKAFEILRKMADDGELDGYLIDYLEKGLEGRER